MAARFGWALNAAIGPEQLAVLPGWRIEDAIPFSSLLPHVAHTMNTSVVLVYLDISKAYDTVSREFVLAVLGQFGCQ